MVWLPISALAIFIGTMGWVVYYMTRDHGLDSKSNDSSNKTPPLS